VRTETKKHIITLAIFTFISLIAIIAISGYVEIPLPQSNEQTDGVVNNTNEDKESIETENIIEDTTDTSEDDDVSSDTWTEDSFILQSTADGGNAYLEKITFIGDKNTYTMGRYVYTGIPDPIRQVWSVEENVSASKIMSVNSFINPSNQEATNYLTAVKEFSPPYLIVSFGSYDNDEEMTKDKLISEIGDFIVKVKLTSPNTQIIIQSIFPVTEDCDIITPTEVYERNEWLKQLCKVYKLYYLDSYSALCDENGILLTEFASADGYLLNENGYRQVVNYIRNHVHPNY